MGGKESKQTVSKLITSATVPSTAARPSRRIAENYLVIWADESIDSKNTDCQNTLDELRSVVNDVNPCTTSTECIGCLNDNKEKISFVIASGALGQHLVPEIHNMPNLNAIYIFCGNKQYHREWVQKWTKIKELDSSIKSICQALSLAIKQCNQNNVSVTIISAHEEDLSKNLNRIEPTFMYSQIFKEILLEMKHGHQAVKDLAKFCKKGEYHDNKTEMKIIKEFQDTYQPSDAIWWYTRECFTYKLLNSALRTLNGDIIIRMGFFLCDIHRQIEDLHKTQVSLYRRQPFKIYRGQGLSAEDFEKLKINKGGLISFNNFLSTSIKRDISLEFANHAIDEPHTVGVLFQMTIDPTISSNPFASIQEISYHNEEAEILFSMHTVFRIDETVKVDSKRPLYQVDLKLTSNDDNQLRQLTESIRREAVGPTGWARLGQMLLKIGQFEKAEELYTALLEQAPTESDRALFYNQLGLMKYNQAKYKEAISFHEKSLKIKRKMLPDHHHELAISYNNIGQVYNSMGDYPKALEFYEKSVEIKKNTFPSNHPSLATSYSNIGSVYNNMGEYMKALEFHEKDLEIAKQTLPPNHPELAVSYNNIGQVYNKMGNYQKALEFYEKAHKIKHSALPPNHPELAISYNNMGAMYKKIGIYSKALEFYEKALKIRQEILSDNHPDLAQSYNNIGNVYCEMKDYSQAKSFLKKALAIWQKSLPSTHPFIRTVLDNLGYVKKQQ
ncbi:unnamed protein product [Rotaria socialis]|uniref:ADP ribosyltransferase domain-containing protein n=2 Tax=Rotaria socialis TaxID=392032 RepID=A0A817YLL5_9BILA|nr:unnamed protein product [Rotaria socialis]CAF4441911.1 unnamed protein product [Rotaria socialis]